jgi:putative hemolysin
MSEIIIILFLIIANGILATAEFAVVSARRPRLERRAQMGDSGARAALELGDNPSRFLSTVQIGITLIGILAGAFGGAKVAVLLSDWLSNVALLDRYSDAIGLAIVVDEFGGIAGLVTFKQLVGEVVGQVHQEGEVEELLAVGEDTFQIEGTMRIDAYRRC